MTNTTEKRQINDLTVNEINLIYSLMRIGDWPALEIGRVYRLSEEDITKVFDNYPELLEAAEKNPYLQEQPRQDPSQERIEKPRKRRNDARFVTAADRQKAYRTRLQERRHTVIEQPSPTHETDTLIPAVEEHSVTVCEAPVSESGPEEKETQRSACYGSSEESYEISEIIPLPFTHEACSEREELRVIEE